MEPYSQLGLEMPNRYLPSTVQQLSSINQEVQSSTALCIPLPQGPSQLAQESKVYML